jgi:CheY-like chemotaxis protein
LTYSGESAKPNRNAEGNPFENPTDLLVDLEPSEYAVRGDPALIERSLVTLVLAAWRSRSQQSKLRIIGKRSTENEKRNSYYLTISGADVPTRTAAFSSPSITFPPTASPFGSWENCKDLDLLGAFATLQAQGCWVDTQAGSRGGLCFDIELALDPNRSLSVDSVLGTQDVERSVENGTGFTTPEEPVPPTARSAPPERPTNNRGFPPILICDDEPRLVALTAGLLREFGFEVLTVRSGADAVKTVHSEPVDLVVLDINLPGEDAHDVILSMLRDPPISVILSSGYTEEDVDPVLLKEPAVKAFLSKPYTVDVLVQTIDRVRSELAQSQRVYAKT